MSFIILASYCLLLYVFTYGTIFLQTLLNATASLTYPEDKMKGTQALIMNEPRGRSHRYFVKLRPKLKYFLEELSPLFQMSIYTHGTRQYAEGTCKLMDPNGVYFGKRIVSRTDHPELGANKSLAHLLKTDWSMVLIYDDREDVWRKGDQGDHLLCAKPFVHFDQKAKGGVINNAPGLLSMQSKADQNASSSEEPDTQKKILEKVVEQVHDNNDKDDDDEEEDDGLVQAVAVFKKLHELYFSSISKSGESNTQVSVGNILHNFRRESLRGCVICFTGVIPIGTRKPKHNALWRIATKLGAEVTQEITPETTHLLGVGVGGEKCHQCLKRDDVFVLHCDWLLHCHWNIRREDEAGFFLSADHKPSLVNEKIEKRISFLGVCIMLLYCIIWLSRYIKMGSLYF